MYRTAYSICYTEGDSPVIGGIERLRVKDKTLRQEPPRQTTTPGEVKEVPAALGNGEETLTRKELGKLFNVSHEAIRIWEESGKLLTLGWQRIPLIKSPVKYSRTS